MIRLLHLGAETRALESDTICGNRTFTNNIISFQTLHKLKVLKKTVANLLPAPCNRVINPIWR